MDDAENDKNSIRDLLALGLNESLQASQQAGSESMVPAEGRAFAEFELIEQIGQGGMGVIYRAREQATQRIVAVKMIAAGLIGIEKARQRFEREVRAAAKLRHQYILPIYRVNEWGGIPYFSMRFAEGGSLMDRLPDFSHAAPDESARLVLKIALGIQHAHGRGVLHRDLKPANILLDAEGEPLIADFGLAQLFLDESIPDLTGTLVVIGTPGYIAPEMAQGLSAPTTDIYGLGAILYHLLTGNRPFDGSDGLSSLTQAAANTPLPARHFRKEVPKSLELICECCLQPDPSSRYHSAEEFTADLERAIEGRAARGVRRGNRQRLIVGVFGTIALAVIGLSIFLGLHLRRNSSTREHIATEARYFVDHARATLAREHSESNLRSAEQALRRALKIDPASAAVHAELSRLLSKIFWHIAQDQSTSKEARSEAETALRLDAQLAASHLAMGEYLFRCRRDYPAALEWLGKAGELDARTGSIPALRGIVLKRLGRWEEALQNSRRACELEPKSAPLFYELAVTCDVLRRYSEATSAIERAKYFAPDNPTHKLLHAWLLFRGEGDATGLEDIVTGLPFEQQMSPQYFDTVFLWLLWSHRPAEALRWAEALPDDYTVRRYDAYLLKPYFVGLAQSAAGDATGATTSFEIARRILESLEEKDTDDARVRSQLGVVYAALGRQQDAVREGRRAVELLPISREPVGGSYVATQLAEIYARVGQVDGAVSLIEDLLARPGHLTIHELKIDPRWDPLRDDARFQRLLANQTLKK